jgi:hypothetical protein
MRARLAAVGALVCGLAAGVNARALAQSTHPERPLPVTGTLLYNLLFLSHPPDIGGDAFGARFAGRVAIWVAPRTYFGVGVGSWAQALTERCTPPVNCGTFADYWSEAIVYQFYAQHAPATRFPGWLRLGAGLANTTTLAPAGRLIRLDQRWRVAVTGGAGADVRVAGHLLLTTSIDYTVLPGVERGSRELRHALALGLGLTIR